MMMWLFEPKIDWNLLLSTIKSENPVAMFIVINSAGIAVHNSCFLLSGSPLDSNRSVVDGVTAKLNLLGRRLSVSRRTTMQML